MAKSQSKKKKEDNSCPKIGVYVCHCGTNIAGSVNIEEVVNFSKTIDKCFCCKRTYVSMF